MSEDPSEPEFPDWLGKVLGLIGLFVLLSAVLAALSVLVPRLIGF